MPTVYHPEVRDVSLQPVISKTNLGEANTEPRPGSRLAEPSPRVLSVRFARFAWDGAFYFFMGDLSILVERKHC